MRLKPKMGIAAREKATAADLEAIWDGKFRCCGLPIKGTPKEIARIVDDHRAKGCKGTKEE